ncbi:MAG: ribonuclease T [Cellvibrionales bacterium TMED148]|nr:ribonuclease T [Porticoccaceae bacterium]RPG91802.1 MAG: ribonuclease T [Cellvibrionales bacterium TMED148]
MSKRFRGFLPVVIDVETGGFNSRTDALLEIGAVLLQMDEQGILSIKKSVCTNVDPFQGAIIEPSAIEFNKIDLQDPNRMALHERDALQTVFRPIRREISITGCTRAIMVAHNAHFDLGFINAAAERNQVKRNPFHPFSCFDTCTLAGLAYGQTVLGRACQSANIHYENNEAHNALYDAIKTAEIFCRIINRWRELGGVRLG